MSANRTDPRIREIGRVTDEEDCEVVVSVNRDFVLVKGAALLNPGQALDLNHLLAVAIHEAGQYAAGSVTPGEPA
jgi:hypothetical protein